MNNYELIKSFEGSPEVQMKLLEQMIRYGGKGAPKKIKSEDVLALYKEGISAQKMADMLEVSVSTINLRLRSATNPIKDKTKRAAKLSKEEVNLIRAKYKFGTYGSWKLAREFGVTPTNILAIIKNRTWK